jgi:hypothetical protein
MHATVTLLPPSAPSRTTYPLAQRYIKVKFTLEHATKAQRGSRGTALLFI